MITNNNNNNNNNNNDHDLGKKEDYEQLKSLSWFAFFLFMSGSLAFEHLNSNLTNLPSVKLLKYISTFFGTYSTVNTFECLQ